jgi:hypothetical protein
VTEVLQEREPRRRGLAVASVVLALLVVVGLVRYAATGGDPAAAPSPTPAARPADVFGPTSSFGSAVDHGEYAYATMLRSYAPERVRVLGVTPLAQDGGELAAVLALPLDETRYDRTLDLREHPGNDGVDVEPGEEFMALVRVRPDCASRRRLAALRVTVRWSDGSQQLQEVRGLSAPEAGMDALREEACEPSTALPGQSRMIELTGGGSTSPPRDGVREYEFDLRSTWPDPVTVLDVVPVDARGRAVPAELAALMTTDSGHPVEGPVELRAGATGAIVLRLRTDCSPARQVTAFRLNVRVGPGTTLRVLQLGPAGPRCGTGG